MSGFLERNFGDDLLFYIMSRLYPEVTFCIQKEGSYAEEAGEPSNLQCLGAVNPPRWNYALRAVNKVLRKLGLVPLALQRRLLGKHFDAFVKLGGSIFMESSSSALRYHIKEDRLLAAHAEASGILDSNFGPYWSDGFKAVYEEHFRSFDFVSFRESHSANLFGDAPNVTYGSDLVFALPAIGVSKIPHEGRRVAVVPIDLAWPRSVDMTAYCEAYETALANLIDEQVDAGADVSLVAFCAREGDMAACQRILGRVSFPERVRLLEHRNVEATVAELASADLIVASRFHGIFFGLALGIPVLPLSYSPKIDNELEDLGCSKHFAGIPELGERLEISSERLLYASDVNEEAILSWSRQTKRFDEVLVGLGYGDFARS